MLDDRILPWRSIPCGSRPYFCHHYISILWKRFSTVRIQSLPALRQNPAGSSSKSWRVGRVVFEGSKKATSEYTLGVVTICIRTENDYHSKLCRFVGPCAFTVCVRAENDTKASVSRSRGHAFTVCSRVLKMGIKQAFKIDTG